MLVTAIILAVALFNVVLGMVVLLKDRGRFKNVSFAIAAFILSSWIVVARFGSFATFSHNSLVWLSRAGSFLPAMGLYFLLLFVIEFTRIGYKNFRPFAIIFGFFTLFVALMSTTNLMIASIEIRNNVVVTKPGPYTLFYSLFVVLLSLANIVLLMRYSQTQTGANRARTRVMIICLATSFLVALTTNLVLPLGLEIYGYGWIGLVSTVIIVGGFTYAIVKQRLFEIRAFVTRSITYFMLLATLGSAYAFVVFYLGNAIFNQTNVSISQQTFDVVIALILAFTFQPLQRFFAKVTDSIFYRDHYDPELLLNEVSHILATEIGLIELSSKVRSLLMRRLKVDNVDIIVLNEGRVFTESGHYVVSRLQDLAQDLNQLRGKTIVVDEELEGQRKQVLQQYGINVFATLHTKKDKRIGYLLFGSKLSGDIFTNTDIKVINNVADQLAIAVQNAKAYVEIQRFNQTLRSKITVATQKLRDANQNLKQIDVIKDDFLSMASHQLRTPLTVVEGYISNILDGIYGELNQEQRDAIALTQSRVRLTRALVVDLLNISRMEAGRFFIDLQPSDLNKAVEDEISHLNIVAKEHDVKVSFEKPKTAVPITSLDDQKIRQVIMNLIDNAITYSPGGKVTVRLYATDKQIEFTVKDTGIGVPKAQQRQLFTKFYRADNAKRTRPDGTGIGLFLVKQVIEAHGGHIIFSSEEKKGSIFGFSVPITTTNTEQHTKPIPSLAKHASRVKVA